MKSATLFSTAVSCPSPCLHLLQEVYWVFLQTLPHACETESNMSDRGRCDNKHFHFLALIRLFVNYLHPLIFLSFPFAHPLLISLLVKTRIKVRSEQKEENASLCSFLITVVAEILGGRKDWRQMRLL